MFPIQYMQLFGAIINNEGRFVLDLIDPLKKWLLGKVSTTKTHFGMHWAKIHASPGELWMRSRNKKIIKARDGITSPISPSQPVCIGHRFFCVVGRTVDLIKHAKFKPNRFRDFGALARLKLTLLH